MFLRSSSSSRAPLVGLMAGAVGALILATTGSIRATVVPSSVVIANFSDGTADGLSAATSGVTMTVVSSGTSDGNMLQLNVPWVDTYWVQIAMANSNVTAANFNSYQDLSLDVLAPSSTVYTGSSISAGFAYTTGANNTWSQLYTFSSQSVSDGNIVNLLIPLDGASSVPNPAGGNMAGPSMQPLPNGGSNFQFNLILPPGWNTGSAPSTFDIGNIAFVNPLPVPEPTTIGLLAFGGLGLLLVGRRRKSA